MNQISLAVVLSAVSAVVLPARADSPSAQLVGAAGRAQLPTAPVAGPAARVWTTPLAPRLFDLGFTENARAALEGKTFALPPGGRLVLRVKEPYQAVSRFRARPENLVSAKQRVLERKYHWKRVRVGKGSDLRWKLHYQITEYVIGWAPGVLVAPSRAAVTVQALGHKDLLGVRDPRGTFSFVVYAP